jgi:hypothetical protein
VIKQGAAIWIAVSLGIVVLAVFFGWALLVPAADWLASHDIGNSAGTSLETARNNARGNILALTAGLAGFGALVFTARNFALQRRALTLTQRTSEDNAELARRTLEHSEQSQQRMHELAKETARENAYDASQRRITELYVKAIEQVGHEKATVRLGGLYSLERLAQGQPEQRQLIVDFICAYLRMPFKPKALPITGSATFFLDIPAANELCRRIVDENVGETESNQEIQVRTAAQRILARHFSASRYRSTKAFPDSYWPRIKIDLTGAVLINLDFSACRLDYSDFRHAKFLGMTMFNSAEFINEAKFEHAMFAGKASLHDVIFYSYTGFSDADFSQSPDFQRASTPYPSRHVWPADWSVMPPSSGAEMGRLGHNGDAGPDDDEIVFWP